MTEKLPNKLSALIRVAIKDLRQAARDPIYKLDMARWHQPSNEPGKCCVCMAGAVMAFSLGISPRRSLEPQNFPDTTYAKLRALNLVRTGYLFGALSQLGLIYSVSKKSVLDEASSLIRHATLTTSVPGLAPAKVYLKVAEMLESVGL
jgi:hypothetical protein